MSDLTAKIESMEKELAYFEGFRAGLDGAELLPDSPQAFRGGHAAGRAWAVVDRAGEVSSHFLDGLHRGLRGEWNDAPAGLKPGGGMTARLAKQPERVESYKGWELGATLRMTYVLPEVGQIEWLNGFRAAVRGDPTLREPREKWSGGFADGLAARAEIAGFVWGDEIKPGDVTTPAMVEVRRQDVAYLRGYNSGVEGEECPPDAPEPFEHGYRDGCSKRRDLEYLRGYRAGVEADLLPDGASEEFERGYREGWESDARVRQLNRELESENERLRAQVLASVMTLPGSAESERLTLYLAGFRRGLAGEWRDTLMDEIKRNRGEVASEGDGWLEGFMLRQEIRVEASAPLKAQMTYYHSFHFGFRNGLSGKGVELWKDDSLYKSSPVAYESGHQSGLNLRAQILASASPPAEPAPVPEPDKWGSTETQPCDLMTGGAWLTVLKHRVVLPVAAEATVSAHGSLHEFEGDMAVSINGVVSAMSIRGGFTDEDAGFKVYGYATMPAGVHDIALVARGRGSVGKRTVYMEVRSVLSKPPEPLTDAEIVALRKLIGGA